MHQEHDTNPGSRAPRIAIAVESLGGGGVQHRTRSLAKAFAEAGYIVDVYVSKNADGSRKAAAPGVTVLELRGSGRRGLIQSLARALQLRPPDLLFSTGTTLHPVAVGAKRVMPHLALILRADSYPFRTIPWTNIKPRLLEPYRRRQRRSWFRSADLAIAVSDGVADAVRGVAPDAPIETLHSPVIDGDFRAALALGPPDHPWTQDGTPIAVAVGRVALAKDYPTLLRATALATARRPFRLVILGDGKEGDKRKLERLARSLGIEDRVAFLGWTHEVPQWLRAASVFVSTSIWEGSPGAVIEALAAGTPVVATDCPGDTRNLLKGGELGQLVPVGDIDAIAEAIEKSLHMPGDAHARRAAAKPFDEARACAAYLAVIDAFLASRREFPASKRHERWRLPGPKNLFSQSAD